MNTQASFTLPTQADVDRLIAQAHQMRSENTSRLLTSALARLRGVFAKADGLGQSSA